MGERGFRKDLWQKWKREALEDKTALFIGMGDYSDSFRTSIQKKLRSAFSGDSSAEGQLEDMLLKEMQNLAVELKPFASRIIGLHEGHHYYKLMGGGTTTTYLCQLLKTKYLGFAAGVQLVLRRMKTNARPEGHVVDIFSTHGCGGASNVASDLANLERKIMPFWDADIFIRGHSTKAYVVDGHPLNYLTRPGGQNDQVSMHHKKRLLVNTGGFMAGYVEGHSSYVEQSNMAPCALGWTVINLHIPAHGNEPLKIRGYAVTE